MSLFLGLNFGNERAGAEQIWRNEVGLNVIVAGAAATNDRRVRSPVVLCTSSLDDISMLQGQRSRAHLFHTNVNTHKIEVTQ